MDFLTEAKRFPDFMKKYRYMILLLLVGLILMWIPSGESEEEIPGKQTVTQEIDLQENLSKHLSMVAGAGTVKVLLTESAGAETIYQIDEDRATGDHGGDQRRQTILVTGTDRSETGLIKRIDPPSYQGAIILCQGAENARVRLSLVEAVSNATGLSSDKITVLKMN